MDNREESAQGHGLGWSYGRWRKIFDRLDKEAVAVAVRELARKHPKEDQRSLVRRVVRRAARLSAMVGVASASPALLPGIGTAVAVVGVVPEEIYLVRRKCLMILQISAVYGFDATDDERLYEILALAGSPSRTIEAVMTAKHDLRRIAAKAAASMGPRVGGKRLLGAKVLSRGVVRRLPALGFFVGAAINYFSFKAVGRRASRYYQRLREERME